MHENEDGVHGYHHSVQYGDRRIRAILPHQLRGRDRRQDAYTLDPRRHDRGTLHLPRLDLIQGSRPDHGEFKLPRGGFAGTSINCDGRTAFLAARWRFRLSP